MLRSLFLVALLALASATSDDNTLDDDVDRTTTTLSNIKLPGELSLPSNFLSSVATAGAVVLGALGVAALLAILLPLFGVKLCYLTGTCDPLGGMYGPPHMPPQPAGGVGSPHAYDAYGTSGYSAQAPANYGSTAYQRRSLEYVGPILRALSTAYDKYAAPRIVGKGSRASGGAEASGSENVPTAAQPASRRRR